MKAISKLYVFKLIAIFLVVFLASFYLKENLNGFPYGGIILERYEMPYVLSAMANFDGVHYTNIAYEGYHTYDQAFFPLYPILIAGFGKILGGNHVVSAVLLSITAGYIGLYYIYKLLREKYDKKLAFSVIVFLLAFPTAFYFQAIYTESIFLALIASCLYMLHKKKYGYVAVIAASASLARIQGVFILIPIVLHFVDLKNLSSFKPIAFIKKRWILMISPFVGLSGYMVYLYITTGDPLFFFTSQPSFGANRSTSIILLPQVYYRYLKIFFTAQMNHQYFVASIEFMFFTMSFALSILLGYKAYIKKNSFELGLALFSLAYIILPTLTGTFSSIPRYSLLALVQYLAFARIKTTKYKYGLLIIFISTQILLLSLFARGYFVS